MCPLWLIIGTTTAVDDLTVLRTPRGEWKNRGNSAPYGPHGRLSLNSLNMSVRLQLAKDNLHANLPARLHEHEYGLI